MSDKPKYKLWIDTHGSAQQVLAIRADISVSKFECRPLDLSQIVPHAPAEQPAEPQKWIGGIDPGAGGDFSEIVVVPNPSKAEGRRLTIDLTAEASEEVERLRKQTGETTADFFRSALSVYRKQLTEQPAEPSHCPTCGSPAPHQHPAVQFEGEVETCPDAFHLRETPQNKQEYRDAVIAKRKVKADAEPSKPLSVEEARARGVCTICKGEIEFSGAVDLNRFAHVACIKGREQSSQPSPATTAESGPSLPPGVSVCEECDENPFDTAMGEDYEGRLESAERERDEFRRTCAAQSNMLLERDAQLAERDAALESLEFKIVSALGPYVSTHLGESTTHAVEELLIAAVKAFDERDAALATIREKSRKLLEVWDAQYTTYTNREAAEMASNKWDRECQDLFASLRAAIAPDAGKPLLNRLEKAEAIIAKHNLCHDLHGKVGREEFEEGCRRETIKEFGSCGWADELERLRSELSDYKSAAEVEAGLADEFNSKLQAEQARTAEWREAAMKFSAFVAADNIADYLERPDGIARPGSASILREHIAVVEALLAKESATETTP